MTKSSLCIVMGVLGAVILEMTVAYPGIVSYLAVPILSATLWYEGRMYEIALQRGE